MNELLENFSRQTVQNIDDIYAPPAMDVNSNLYMDETNEKLKTVPLPYVPPIKSSHQLDY